LSKATLYPDKTAATVAVAAAANPRAVAVTVGTAVRRIPALVGPAAAAPAAAAAARAARAVKAAAAVVAHPSASY